MSGKLILKLSVFWLRAAPLEPFQQVSQLLLVFTILIGKQKFNNNQSFNPPDLRYSVQAYYLNINKDV